MCKDKCPVGLKTNVYSHGGWRSQQFVCACCVCVCVCCVCACACVFFFVSFFFVSVSLSLCLSVSLFLCWFVGLFLCLSVCLFVCVVDLVSLNVCQHCSCTSVHILCTPANVVTSALAQVFSKNSPSTVSNHNIHSTW